MLPGITPLRVDESYDYLLDTFVEWRRRGLTIKAIQAASALLDNDDHEGARRELLRELIQINDEGLVRRNDEDITKTVEARIDNYVARKETPVDILGIPTGFPTIDWATNGLQPGQLVTIIAPPKTGKSTLATAIARNIHAIGKVPLLISFEMSNPENSVRVDTMVSGVAKWKLEKGQFDDREEARLRKKLKQFSESPNPFYIVNDRASTATVSQLCAKVDRYKPDVLLVDGVYMMLDEHSGEQNTPAALTNITRSLKAAAQRLEIPIVESTQVLLHKMVGNRVSARSIGYSSSFFQDSDVLLALERVDGDEDNDDERTLRVEASRNCPQVETTIQWSWDTGVFEEYPHDDDD